MRLKLTNKAKIEVVWCYSGVFVINFEWLQHNIQLICSEPSLKSLNTYLPSGLQQCNTHFVFRNLKEAAITNNDFAVNIIGHFNFILEDT